MKYKTRLKPWEKQREALRKMGNREVFALLMAMRTGKTKVTLDNFGQMELDGKVQDLMVIGPAGALPPWEKAIQEHCSLDLLERVKTFYWRSSDKTKETERTLKRFLSRSDGPRIFMINIEAVGRVVRAREAAQSFLGPRKSVCVVDESTTIKGPDSDQTKYVLGKIRPLANYRRILSGLPTPNSPLDLWSQFYFLDPDILGHETFTTFRSHYAEVYNICMLPTHFIKQRLTRKTGRSRFLVDGIGVMSVDDMLRDQIIDELDKRKIYIPKVPLIKKFRNEEELNKLIQPHSIRVRLEDCYDVPPSLYLRREVRMTDEQKRIYKELREQATSEIENEEYVTATQVITRILRLHQILCGHVIDEEGKYHDIKERRTDELIDLLNEYDGKAIIWTSYDPTLRKILKAIEKEFGEGSHAAFWGGNTKVREQEQERFLNDPRCRFMVATPASGGRGRTWMNANMVVYYSNTNNLEHRLQSEERPKGVGKKEKITYVDLVVPETVDDKIIHALRNKINMATTITGDNYMEWLI